MSESILASIRKSVGVGADCDSFDSEILMAINTSLMALTQVGVGPPDGFTVTGDSETWDDYIGLTKNLNGVKTYVGLSVKLIFDPPQSSFVIESMKNILQETLWRITIECSKGVIV